jgi:hypothetical protein
MSKEDLIGVRMNLRIYQKKKAATARNCQKILKKVLMNA